MSPERCEWRGTRKPDVSIGILGTRRRSHFLLLAALGVVFGDIGTSPLYALRECFDGIHAIPVSTANVLGVLSLIVWSLVITVSVKYVLFVMRADNGGEGGILALVALVRSKPPQTTAGRRTANTSVAVHWRDQPPASSQPSRIK